MDINFSGYKENVLTFQYTGALAPGDLVVMASSGTVEKAAEGDTFIGVCANTRDGYAAVQLSGYTEAKKNGTVNVGYNTLLADAEGVKADADGVSFLVIYSDTDTVGFIL